MSDDLEFATGARTTALEDVKLALKARARAKAETRTLRLTADRPASDVVATFRVPSDGTEIADVQRRAEAKAGKNGPVGVIANRMILARFCESIALDQGEPKPTPLRDDDGNPVAFSSPWLLGLYEVASAADAVFAMYGNDGDIASMVGQLLTAAGFGEDDTVEVVEDPTRT